MSNKNGLGPNNKGPRTGLKKGNCKPNPVVKPKPKK